jgi:hypothetical protein
MLLNQNLVALLSSTREPQNVFLKVQAQLIELAGPQLPNTLPPQAYRARVAIDEPCFRYQQGRCRYPANICDRQHMGAPHQFGSAHTPFGDHRPTYAPKSVTFTVVPCRDFTRGECQRGTACRFAHNNTPGPQALTYGDRRRQSAPISDDCSSKKRVGAAPVELDSESELLINKLESIYTYSQARGPQPLTQSGPSSQSSQSIKSHQYRPPPFLLRTHQYQSPRNPSSHTIAQILRV